MKTISVQIGNSDDKLVQAQWADFVQGISKVIQEHSRQIHFFGGSSNWLTWQNAAWVFDCDDDRIPALRTDLTAMRKNFNQDSVGYLEGETVFL